MFEPSRNRRSSLARSPTGVACIVIAFWTLSACKVTDPRSGALACTSTSDCDAPRVCEFDYCVVPPAFLPDADPSVPDADPAAPDADPSAPDAAPPADADPSAPDASTDTITLVRQVTGDSNDAEEIIATGAVALTSFDLDLGADNVKPLVVGIRFVDIVIPQGATIVSASIQFTVDATDPDATTLDLFAEDADNAPTFVDDSSNLSARNKTTATVSWSPPVWSSIGLAEADQRTPDLASLVSSVTGRAGWASGNALVFLVTGTGQRSAEAYDGAPLAAPVLTVDYTTP